MRLVHEIRLTTGFRRENWITRSILPEDNRAQQLSLTVQGRRILPRLAEIAERKDETVSP